MVVGCVCVCVSVCLSSPLFSVIVKILELKFAIQV